MRRRNGLPSQAVLALARLLAEAAVDEYVREIQKPPPRKPKKRS